MIRKLIKSSLFMAVGTTIYVSGVAWFMINVAEKTFGGMKNLWQPVVLLLLFVLSAGVTGSLVLGQPVMLYTEGKKNEAIKHLTLTLAWLLVILMLIFAVLAISR